MFWGPRAAPPRRPRSGCARDGCRCGAAGRREPDAGEAGTGGGAAGPEAGMRALLAAAKCEPTRLDEGDLGVPAGAANQCGGEAVSGRRGSRAVLDRRRRRELRRSRLSSVGPMGSGGPPSGRWRTRPRRRCGICRMSCARRRGWWWPGEGWHPGVVGIVASRLVERHHRPVVVISLDGEGSGRGSGRSIPGFDLLAGLEACSEYLGSFGGHKAAAGLGAEGGNARCVSGGLCRPCERGARA